MSRYDYNGSSKTLNNTTAETITWQSAEISADSRLVNKLLVELTGTDNDVNSLVETRVKANGEAVWSVDEFELRSALQALYPSNLGPAAADASFSLPIGGFPHGKKMSVEIQKDNSGAAGTAFLGWVESDGEATASYTKYIGVPAQLAASTNNQRFNFNGEGLLVGFMVRASGVSRVKLFLKGIGQILNLRTAMLRQAQVNDNVLTESNYWFFKMRTPLPALEGSYLELDTNGTWSGTGQRVAMMYVLNQ